MNTSTNFIYSGIYSWGSVAVAGSLCSSNLLKSVYTTHFANTSLICFWLFPITLTVSTACVNKSASLKEHFFLGKLYVSFEKVYNNRIGNISFYRIFVLCNLDVWFRNYGKSCEVPPNLFGLIHLYMYYCIHHWWQLEYQCWRQIIQSNTRTFWQK